MFDSTDKHGSPFEFVLGRRDVILAWDVGVATMKKGEKCILTCPPDYAYGSSGAPPVIPPNATLMFEVGISGGARRGLACSSGLIISEATLVLPDTLSHAQLHRWSCWTGGTIIAHRP